MTISSIDRGASPAQPQHNPPPIFAARDLTAGGVTAVIDLDGQNYTLRITRMGKLILTK